MNKDQALAGNVLVAFTTFMAVLSAIMAPNAPSVWVAAIMLLACFSPLVLKSRLSEGSDDGQN